MSAMQLDGVTFLMRIESGNQALVDDPNTEIIRILQKAIAVLADNPPATGVGGEVRDINGNLVGDWGLYVSSPDKEPDEDGDMVDVDLPWRDVNL